LRTQGPAVALHEISLCRSELRDREDYRKPPSFAYK
jgi:hypothetical protein